MINNSDIKVFTNTKREEVEIGRELKVTVTMPKDKKITDLKVLFNMEGENPSVIKELVLDNPKGINGENLKVEVER